MVATRADVRRSCSAEAHHHSAPEVGSCTEQSSTEPEDHQSKWRAPWCLDGARGATGGSRGRLRGCRGPSPRGVVLAWRRRRGRTPRSGPSLSWLCRRKRRRKRRRRSGRRVMEERMSALARAWERVRDGLPLSSAEDAAWRQWSGLPPRQEKRRKKKKRKKRKLPKSSSSGCRRPCDNQRQVPAVHSFMLPVQFLDKVLDMPVVVLRQVLRSMVPKTVVVPQLHFSGGRRLSLSFRRGIFSADHRFSSCCSVSCGRCPCCAGRAVSPVLPWEKTLALLQSLRNRRSLYSDSKKNGFSAVAVHHGRCLFVVMPRLISIFLATIETPQVLFDTVVNADIMQVVQVFIPVVARG